MTQPLDQEVLTLLHNAFSSQAITRLPVIPLGPVRPNRPFPLTPLPFGRQASAAAQTTVAMDVIASTLPTLFGRAPEASEHLPAAMDVLLNATDVAKRFLSVQRAADGPGRFMAPANWLASVGEENLFDAARTQYGFTGLMTAAALAFALQQQAEKHLDQLIQIGFGVDPVNSTIRNRLIGLWGGIHDPVQIGIEIPGPHLPFADAVGNTCLGALRTGLAELGQAASGMPRELLAAIIRSITPSHGCAGTVVRIEGSGFGAVQPANAVVLFSAYAGGPLEAKVNAWSDTAIEVTAPADVGDGPITLVGIGQANAGTTIATAADTLAGAAAACLGPGAGRVAGMLGRIPLGTASPIRNLQTNVFHGGRPRIVSFTGNTQSPVVAMRPNGMLRLEWDVKNAADVRIETVAGGIWIPPMNRTFPVKGSLDIGPLAGTASWQEQIKISASNGCGNVAQMLDVQMKDRTALVLSGGGSKASFEVGAVRCLYDVFGLTPDIITGSSAGSLNAVKLAEGPSALPQLEQMWLGLSGPADMFQPTPAVVRILTQWKITGLLPQQLSELSDMLGVQVSEYSWVSPEMEIAIGVSKEVFSQAVPTNGLLLIADILFKGLKLGLAIGKLIQEIQRLLNSGNSLFLFDPIRNLLDANVDPAKVAGSGINLRVSVLDMNSGRTRYVDERGRFADNGEHIPLLDAVQASASIPVAFPPVVTPSGTYLDGGTRDNLPLAIADTIGASSIVAIVPSPLGVGRGNYANATLLPLAGRTVEVIMDELQLTDYKPHRGFGCPTRVIAPSFEVHNLFKVDPGLVQISMDYGYLRAYDVMQSDDRIRSRLLALSDQITQLRLLTWGPSEHRSEGELMPEERWGFISNGLQRTPSADSLAEVRRRKIDLRELFRQRQLLAGAPACNPAGIERAWQQWELHSWTPLLNTPWDATTAHVGPALPAVPPPPPL
jgi:predicted acylesterase/phospholipase RssA